MFAKKQREKEIKVKLRQDMVALMQKKSKCITLTKKFLINLGD